MQRILIGLGLTLAVINAAPLYAGELDGGGWRGTWTDNNSGHEGPLHGRFQQNDCGDYRVVFTGKFAKVVPFRFKTTLKVVGQEGDKVIMAGESRVALFWKFSYNATADAHCFSAQYHSRRWTGDFQLSR